MIKWRIGRLNTLRNQIWVGFLLVMVIVLAFADVFTYHDVSSLLKNNAGRQIRQTAEQANGRLESLYRQIDMLTVQIATDAEVQQTLLDEVEGKFATFNQRQSLAKIISSFQTYSDGIHSLELYSDHGRRLYPLDEGGLSDRIGEEWIRQADLAAGRMVWIGTDPKFPQNVLALRRVSLFDRWFSSGGYLLIQINRDYFRLQDSFQADRPGEYMLLFDDRLQPVTTNYEGGMSQILGHTGQILSDDSQTVTVDDTDYIAVKQTSDATGMTLIILSPVSSVTNGISILRSAVIASGLIGFLLFFILSLFLSTMMTKPMLKLIKSMRSAKLGALRPNPETSSTVEIKELNRTYNEMVENINRLIQIVYEKELLRSRTELKALQAQIDPHFLYNTLEALFWSLEEKGEKELAEFVVAMSDLFRYTIGGSDREEWVPVKRELEHIERYLMIMKMRFGERLTWRISSAPECDQVKIPKLMIQPLVENAIVHGIGDKKARGFVNVSISRTAPSADLLVCVEDDGAGMDEKTLAEIRHAMAYGPAPSLKGSGMGIANVHRRIQLYYKNGEASGGIAISSRKGEGTRVQVTLPYE